jgi:hypothetical protein
VHSSPIPFETQALVAALEEVGPRAPTACTGWTAHELVAHMAAGAKENADLIEDKLAGRPRRATRGFAEREAPFVALDDGPLRKALATQGARKRAAVDALADTDDPVFEFTGRDFSVTQTVTHTRSEAALHRWDLVGDDDISDLLLAQPELTAHAVEILNTLPMLHEAPGCRSDHAGITGDLRIVLRSPGTDDITYARTPRGSRFVIEDGPAAGDALVTTDAANRLLALWGRRSNERHLSIETDSVAAKTVTSVLWPSATPWPRSDRIRRHDGVTL